MRLHPIFYNVSEDQCYVTLDNKKVKLKIDASIDVKTNDGTNVGIIIPAGTEFEWCRYKEMTAGKNMQQHIDEFNILHGIKPERFKLNIHQKLFIYKKIYCFISKFPYLHIKVRDLLNFG